MRPHTLIPYFLLTLAACGDEKLGDTAPKLSQPDALLDFGTLPLLQEKRAEVPLLNVGRAPLVISEIQLAQHTGDVFRVLASPATVEAGATENLLISFLPTAEKRYENTLSFETDDADNPIVRLLLKGRGLHRSVMVVEPTGLDFGRVGECTTSFRQLTLRSTGTAALLIHEIAFTDDSSAALRFLGSTRTPVTVAASDEMTLTVQLTLAKGMSGTVSGGVRLKTTDPQQQEVTIPITARVNQAPVAVIGEISATAAPGETIAFNGGQSRDADGDTPLTYAWKLVSKPLMSKTTITTATQVALAMTLDAEKTGSYAIELNVTDASGVSACMPARSTITAVPAEKLFIELFWENAGTDLDLHVLRTPEAQLFNASDDCYYLNRSPDWGKPGGDDNPSLTRDALKGYGPEVFSYVNPIDTTYRAAVVFTNELLSPMPASKATVRIYIRGILKAETSKTLLKKDEVWMVGDVAWPSGEVTILP